MDLSLQGVTLRQGSQGRLLWTLNATRADYRKDQGIVLVTDPEILYFQEEESTPVYVEGDHGRIDQKNDQADIWSHVLVRYQGSVLTTQSLHYNGTSSLLLCNKDVEIRRKDMVLTSQRATLELATKRVQAHGQVKAVLMADSPLPSP
jgi:LPS export ABC transporter protein LptC